jgi:hypothetical protein
MAAASMVGARILKRDAVFLFMVFLWWPWVRIRSAR